MLTLEIDEDQMRSWFNLHPSEPVDIKSLMMFITQSHGYSSDRKRIVGDFLVNQLEDQIWVRPNRPAPPVRANRIKASA